MPTQLEAVPESNHTIHRFAADDPVGTVTVLCQSSMPADAAMSLRQLDLHSWLPPGKAVEFNMISQGSVLTVVRNEAVQRMRGEWLIFIDDDMVYDPSAVRRLVETRNKFDLDIVGGLCFRRGPPYNPTMYMREQPQSGMYNFLEAWEPEQVIEVDATGMAFVIIHKRVFERIAGSPMPPWEERDRIGLPRFFRWEGNLGEDLRFCQDAKIAGCRIWVDTAIKIGHVTERTITEQDFLMELALRNPSISRERRKANAAMGLKTRTRKDALRMLGL